MDSTTPQTTPSPTLQLTIDDCLLTMAMTAGYAKGYDIGISQRNGTALDVSFVAAFARSACRLPPRVPAIVGASRRMHKAPPADCLAGFCFPTQNPKSAICSREFYYVHALCFVNASDLRVALHSHKISQAMQFGIDSFLTTHQFAVLIRRRCAAGLSHDPIVAVILHQFDSLVNGPYRYSYGAQLFRQPTIGLFANGDVMLADSIPDVDGWATSPSVKNEIHKWISTGKFKDAEV